MTSQRPLLFLDFDDVLCIHGKAGLDLAAGEQSDDLFRELFHAPATDVLRMAVQEFSPRVVVTSGWLLFLERPGVETLFRRTGLAEVAESLHAACEAPPIRGRTRLWSIERWLAAHHRGERFVVLDDELSGTGLRNSTLHRQGHVVLCRPGIGLHRGHLSTIRAALSPARDGE